MTRKQPATVAPRHADAPHDEMADGLGGPGHDDRPLPDVEDSAADTAPAQIAGLRVPRWVLGVVSAILILGGASFYSEQTGSAAFTPAVFGMGEPPAIGQPAPDFGVVDLSGASVRLSDYRGRPVWINFWASWCPPCRAEMPEIEAAYAEAQAGGLVLLAISVGEAPETVRGYLGRINSSIPAVLDPDSLVAARYALSGFPTHVFIDKDGIVRESRVGGLSLASIRTRLATIMDR